MTNPQQGRLRDEVRLIPASDCFHIETRQFIPHPPHTVFTFFEDPGNLSQITPDWLHFRLLDGQDTAMSLDARFRYRLTWLGIPIRWHTRITGYDPPVFFEDTQEQGPYQLWQHQHRFREADGGTWVEDVVRYRLPFGPLGELAHAAIVRTQLERIFLFRAEQVAAHFQG